MDKNFQALIVVFIIILLGAIFTSTIGDTIDPIVNTYTTTNQTTDVEVARGAGGLFNQTVEIPISNNSGEMIDISEIRMENGTILTITTDYLYTAGTDIFQLKNTTKTSNMTDSNNTLLDYTYYPDDYVKNSSSRIIMNLLTLFFALGIILFVLAIIFKENLKDWVKQ